MPRCLISFGANIGDAKSTVLYANQLLEQMLAPGDSVQLSRLYQTPPVGGPAGQSQFINAVAAVQTRLSPWEVWHVIRSIENQLGRERQRRWEARRIDLDILLYDDRLIWTPQLKIPHPRMCMRSFILKPALDVAAHWLDPVSRMTLQQLSDNLASNSSAQFADYIFVSPDHLPLASVLAEAQRGDVSSVTPESIQMVKLNELDKLLPTNATSRICKLLVVWVDAKEGSAWEDQHRTLAIKLRLSDSVGQSASTTTSLPFIGPRYLLATSDHSWAVHEIRAAFEAMHCEIHPVA
ncbi:MAG: 2-amino-4-hydroxy-6-hydroxymethyldihydropteridine diphosphokinase [Pirellulales bacterium]